LVHLFLHGINHYIINRVTEQGAETGSFHGIIKTCMVIGYVKAEAEATEAEQGTCWYPSEYPLLLRATPL